MDKPLENALCVLRFYKWQCDSGRKHQKENKEVEEEEEEEEEEGSVFAGAGLLCTTEKARECEFKYLEVHYGYLTITVRSKYMLGKGRVREGHSDG